MKPSRIRLSEMFVSVQGEGPRVGMPTTFVRLAGCNFRCPGWGVETTLPNGKVVTGCDSPHSVFPEIFMKPGNSTYLSAEELLEKIPTYPNNVCITGGEPLLQAKPLTPVLEGLLERGQTVEVFTNGSIPIGEFRHALYFVMDCKLDSSGEGRKFKFENFLYLDEQDRVKFVIGNRLDYEEAKSIMERAKTFVESNNYALNVRFMMGVVYGVLEPTILIEWILEDKLDLDLNLQTQQLIGIDESERTDFNKVV